MLARNTYSHLTDSCSDNQLEYEAKVRLHLTSPLRMHWHITGNTRQGNPEGAALAWNAGNANRASE